jgi:eukaryotic-like serine/threonine-protein kinase
VSVVADPRPRACLSEDELLELAAGALAEAPAAEAHLATCATCSALLAGVVRGAPARAWDALAGSTLGPYRIDAQIGAGGMGAVYRAWDPRLGRAIAVKVLHGGEATRADRLAAEARAAASIDHRAIVGIHDVGVADGIPYVAMELVDGESLRSVLVGGALGVARARALALELVDGLAAAHAQGVVHRDLKPENLVVARDGLRILDFGLARLAGVTALDATEPGTVQGTAGYMAPEQARGEAADARADVFAAGAITYELATGRRAFPGATHADRLSATLRDTPPLDELGELAPIVARCLAKEPRDRFQSAADLAWALRTASPAPAASPGVPARLSRRALLAGGGGAVAVGALGTLLGRWRAGAARPADSPALRPLTHRTGRVYSARFTHDGSRVVYGAAWDADPVSVHVLELGSGETFALDLPSADAVAVSARGELAVTLGHRFIDHQSARGHLAVVPLSGGAPRPLADDVQDADFAPYQLPEGSPPVAPAVRVLAGALAVVRAGERGFRIELPIGHALVEDPGWLTHARVSPDGAHVAYLRHPHSNDDGGKLMIADVATKATRVVADGWVSLAGLVWDPRGDALWFTASRDGLSNVMYRATLGGEVTAVPVRTAGRLRLHDMTADRRAIVTVDAWRLRAMVGDRDRSLSDVSYVSDISADGTQVVIGELGELEAGTGAYLVPYAGGRPLRLGNGFPVAISPSGQLVAANVRVDDHLVVYATGSGEAPAIATPGFVTVARWIDERALVALFDHRLWRLSLDGAPVALADTGGPFALDPARRRCAYVDRAHTLRVLDLATGAARALPGELTRAEVCGWLAEPDAIVVRSTTTPIALDRIDPSTGARTRHLDVQPPAMGLKAVDSFVLHAGGTRYAYSYGQELSQLFLMNAAS